jgi:hypothetical protein
MVSLRLVIELDALAVDDEWIADEEMGDVPRQDLPSGREGCGERVRRG